MPNLYLECVILLSMANPKSFPSDPELIQACLRGDQAAWKELVTRYGRLVYSIPRRYGLSAVDAEDVFQNVFAIALKRLESLRNQQSLAAWLITVTRHETERVGARRITTEELDEWLEDEQATPQTQVQQWERQHIVHLALERLEKTCRELLMALFLEPDPASYEQIARQLGIPLGSIGPTRARCFKKLETILVALGFDPD